MTGHATHGPPLCKGHQEPFIKKQVNKSGPNKGGQLPSLHGCLKAFMAFMTRTLCCMFSLLSGPCVSALWRSLLWCSVRLTLASHNTCCNHTNLVLAKKGCRPKQRLFPVRAYIALNGANMQGVQQVEACTSA